MQLFQLSSFDFSSKYSKGRRISNVCDFPPCIFTVLLRYSQQTPRVFLTGNRIHIQMWFPSASLSVSLALLLCAHTLHETDKEAVGNHICICIRSPVKKTLGVCWLLPNWVWWPIARLCLSLLTEPKHGHLSRVRYYIFYSACSL